MTPHPEELNLFTYAKKQSAKRKAELTILADCFLTDTPWANDRFICLGHVITYIYSGVEFEIVRRTSNKIILHNTLSREIQELHHYIRQRIKQDKYYHPDHPELPDHRQNSFSA